jgi:hypothetical protein
MKEKTVARLRRVTSGFEYEARLGIRIIRKADIRQGTPCLYESFHGKLFSADVRNPIFYFKILNRAGFSIFQDTICFS